MFQGPSVTKQRERYFSLFLTNIFVFRKTDTAWKIHKVPCVLPPWLQNGSQYTTTNRRDLLVLIIKLSLWSRKNMILWKCVLSMFCWLCIPVQSRK